VSQIGPRQDRHEGAARGNVRSGRDPVADGAAPKRRRRRGGPAGLQLVASTRRPSPVEEAEAEARDHGPPEVATGRAAGRRAATDPAAGRLWLGRSAV